MAIMLLALLALMAFPIFVRSLLIVDLNNTTTTAVATVQSIIEDIRSVPTCANIDSVMGGLAPYHDARGHEYTIEIDLPDGCENAASVNLDIVAYRTRDSKILLNQSVTVLVFEPGSHFEVIP